VTIVHRLTRNSVTACGVFMPRHPSMGGEEWLGFWQGRQRLPVVFDHRRAEVFGTWLERPAGVTSEEWDRFWLARTSLSPGLTFSDNRYADDRWPWAKSDLRRALGE
jgi:hypothetical protein